MPKTARFLTLRDKILFSMVCLLLLAGFFVWVTSRAFLEARFKAVFKEEGITHAQGLAANSLPDLLTLNRSHLQKMIENVKKTETDVAYVFITGSSGEVLVHTFPNGFPVALIRANGVSELNDFKVQFLDTNTMGFVYDIAVPIRLDKKVLGQVRIGIAETGMHQALASLHLVMLATTLAFVVLGMFLAFQLSGLITRPLSKLVEGIEAIKEGDFSPKIAIRSADEIGLLAEAFNKMSDRLKTLLDETAVLARSRERERIALDFHDSCAQDLVSLLKRIELCEKVIESRSSEVPEELRLLKGYTKDILDRARKMIYDLRSKEDNREALLDRIHRYLEDYHITNPIAVQVNVCGSIDELSVKAKDDVFCIITEALTNAGKHSSAKSAVVDIQKDSEWFHVAVRDDGKGFDVAVEDIDNLQRKKFGLSSMRQRARALGGCLNVRSVLDKGSEVLLEIPLKSDKEGGRT